VKILRRNAPELIATRQSLLSRLKNLEDNQSWRDFFQTYWKLIYAMAIRHGLTEIEAQEVVQDTIIGVFRQMPDFKYDRSKGSFKVWLRQLTKWRIHDVLRHRLRDARIRVTTDDAPGRTSTIDLIPDPVNVNEAMWEEEWNRNLAAAAIQRVKANVRSRQYQIFDLYVVKNWPLAKVASTLGVNAGQIYLAKHRVLALIKQEIKQLESRF
jgi:RNA polymerase sigma factor (sigma-70 family)